MFPKAYRDFPPQNENEVTSKIIQSRIDHIEYLIDEIMPIIFGRLKQDGYDLSKESCNNATILFIEAFKNGLYKSVDMYHPLQEISENMVFTNDVNDISIVSKESIIDNDEDNKVDIT